MNLFKNFNLKQHIQEALEKLGFTQPTEIQEKAIPLLLNNKNIDFHGQAQTGTGKTLAFGLPLIHKIDPTINKVQALIVAPTRELASQIVDSLKPILQASGIKICSIYGGVSILRQMNDLKHGVHIIVGTPGRLNDHLRRKTLNLKDLQILVLDEADKMLDMGFKEEIDEILSFAPKNRQIWLFSATVKPGINEIKNFHMKNVETVRINPKNVSTENTKQYYCMVPMNSRLDALCRFIDSDPEFYGFIFCPTKLLTAEICEKLSSNGYKVNSLHGDMEQFARTRVINQFKEKKFTILVATDVAARGLDVPNITHVINYVLPNDQESYVHRIGRTGRAGKSGIAISFVNNSELRLIKRLNSKFNSQINSINVPSFNDIIKVQISRISEYLKSIVSKELNEKYIADLNSAVSNLSQDEIRNALLNILQDKFLKRFDFVQSKTPVNYLSRSEIKISEKSELMISLGSEDGITQDDVKNYLLKNTKLTDYSLERIKVLRRKTFVILPTNETNGLIACLKNATLNGKRARLAVADVNF